MTDTLIDDNEMLVKRFACSCLHPQHNLTITLELDKGRVLDLNLQFYVAGKASWRFRLKQIWNLLRGRDGEVLDFDFRLEDTPELLAVIFKALPETHTYTSSNESISYDHTD